MTKILISCTKIADEHERVLFCTAMSVEQINQALTNYALYNRTDELEQCAKEVRELLNILYND